MKKLIVIIAMFVILIWGIRSFAYSRGLKPVDESDTARVSITVPSGSTAEDIGELLEDEGLIRSSGAFRKYVKKEDKASALQAGTFVLQKSFSVSEIVDALTQGQSAEISVTIPEGYTVKDIDALLTEKGLIKEGDISECARTCDFASFDFLPAASNLAPRGGKIEGYLYPDTYFVATENFMSQSFLERMLSTFETKVIDEYQQDIAASGHSLHEIVTMASIIEEETRTQDERAIVSGILWKRYHEEIGLYVDASNRYILDKPTATITASDLDMDSPYNLRKYRGLPPGPIANPGIQSIVAALKPESSPYYYYLHGSDGQIRYAVTNDEHNLNKAKYLR